MTGTPRFLVAALLLLAALACTARAQDGEDPVDATDLLQLQRLESVAVSPDGRQVVYTVESVEGDPLSDDSLAYRRQLYLVDANASMPVRQLTRGSAGASSPAWHPDGNRIAFVREVEDTPQVFILPLLGGEAYQVTHLESGANSPSWSPDGSALLFASSLSEKEVRKRTGRSPRWADERPGRTRPYVQGVRPDPNGSISEIRAWLDENAEDGNPRVFHRLDLQGEHELETAPKYRHFFVVEPDSGRDPVMITPGFGDFRAADWLPDGSGVVIAGTAEPERHPDRVRDSNLYLAHRDGESFEMLVDVPGLALSFPNVSPDGQLIAFLASNVEDHGYAQTELGVTAMQSPRETRIITHDFDRSISDPRWSQDGWYVYFTAPSEGGFPLYRVRPFGVPSQLETAAVNEAAAADTAVVDTAVVDTAAADTIAAAVGDLPAAGDSASMALDPAAGALDAAAAAARRPSPEIEQLTSVERGVVSFDLGRATVFFVAHSVTAPFELYAANLPLTTERRLTTHNFSWIADKRLSHPERHTLTRDEREIEYWIMKPAFFDSARSYPLLVEIHGGPSAMWGPGEPSMWHEFQFFAAKGYGIVFSNPRGSGGYGYDFERANYQDWGSGPAGDVLAAASAAAELPWVDESRQVVTGGSYAGYLTAWIVAHDDRFKAAAAQRGVYDLDTFLGEGNAWRLIPSHFGGYPWDVEGDTLPSVQAQTPEAAPQRVDEPVVADRTPAFDAAVVDDSAAVRDEAALEDSAAAVLDEALEDTAAVYDEAAAAVAASAVVAVEVTDTAAITADSIGLAADTTAIGGTVAADTTAVPPDGTVAADTTVGAADTTGVQGTAAADTLRVLPSPSEVLERNSPLTFVEQIMTPLLIIHADRDLRTGVAQSEMLYKSLKILDRPVEYVRYPDAGHDLSRTGDPRQRLDRILRLYEFFERFVGD